MDKLTRRDFIKTIFFVSSAIIASGCRRIPVEKIIPYVEKPKELTPGVPLWYASTFFDGLEYCSIIVKTLEGRPIKIEGNELSKVTFGGTSPRVQASILGLYDSDRAKEPTINGIKTDWDKIDSEIVSELEKIRANKGKIRILSQTIISPSTKKILSEFISHYPDGEVVFYDTYSASGILEANEKCFGAQFIPDYKFENARFILSFGADFLGTWISPVEYAYRYSISRKVLEEKINLKNEPAQHIQFESRLSLTGSNADLRIPIKPSEESAIILNLFRKLVEIAKYKTFEFDDKYDIASPHDELITKIAEKLWANKGKSIVISDSNDINIQILINAINVILNNYGSTIDLNTPCYLRQCIDSKVYNLIDEMGNGEVNALIIYHVNPVYSFPDPVRFINALRKVPLTIYISNYYDETAEYVKYFCPDHHYLESWNDAEPKYGYYSFSQPVIGNLFNTRQGQDSFLIWMNKGIDYLTYMQNHWREKLGIENEEDFKKLWFEFLEKGVYEHGKSTSKKYKLNPHLVRNAINAIRDELKNKASDEKIELVLYQDISVSDGKYANNPWLQELPDPITKVCWDNYISISPKFADENNIKQGDILKISSEKYSIQLPVLIQPGQTYETIAIALGYGRWKAGKIGNRIGANAFPFITYRNGAFRYSGIKVKFEKVGENYKLAQTQLHYELDGREIVKEITLADLKKGKSVRDKTHKAETFYPEHKYPLHHWAMAIDLNACIGCGACVIACQVENNIPVVGKEEVLKSREMHWIRIDRYYLEDEENLRVIYQPMLCQHCDNAPCEAVCPVSATMHSSEGLNQQIYNRCIGVRFCLNNCPYKVRRFNWYDYTGADSFSGNEHVIAVMNDEIERMVLNPDVTIRSRGVTEKCTLCIQRIQAGKLKAKMENRKLKDGEIKTACQQACPTKAIVFGDLNDPESQISKKFKDQRLYFVLEELNTKPSVGYLAKVKIKSGGEALPSGYEI